MGDPSGSVSWAVGKLLDTGLDVFKKLIRCKTYCAKLQHCLREFEPRVEKAIEDLETQRDTREVGPSNANSKLEWYYECRDTLTKAKGHLDKCGNLRWYSSRLRKYREILAIIELTGEVTALHKDDHRNTDYETNVMVREQSTKIAEMHAVIAPNLDVDFTPKMELQLDSSKLVVGGLELLSMLQQDLTSGGSQCSDHRYVGVCGMGGVGKTLLLKRAYLSKEVQQHFEGYIWLTVGRTPIRKTLYVNLANAWHLQEPEKENEEDLAIKLRVEFAKKRMLFVLDDIWHRQEFDWLDLAQGAGSVNLISTRNEEVLPNTCVKLHLQRLSEGDSWNLFRLNAFDALHSSVPLELDEELEKVARLVAKECDGLPLALQVIGAAMYEKDVGQWKLTLTRLQKSRTIGDGVGKQLFEVLKVSYDDLDERLKKCFFYFAAYPEDYEVDVAELIEYWEAKELVPKYADDPDVRADAHDLLQALIRRSFIEVVEGALGAPGCRCKIHDVMRDLVFYIDSADGEKVPEKQLFLSHAGQKLGTFPSRLDSKIV